jgi:hypothetical protein
MNLRSKPKNKLVLAQIYNRNNANSVTGTHGNLQGSPNFNVEGSKANNLLTLQQPTKQNPKSISRTLPLSNTLEIGPEQKRANSLSKTPDLRIPNGMTQIKKQDLINRNNSKGNNSQDRA